MILELTDKYSDSLIKLISNTFNYEAKKECILQLINDKNIIKFIYVKDNKLVGSIFVESRIDYIKEIKYYYLNYLCIDDNYRNSNIGTSLLNKVELLAKENGISYIEFTCSKSRLIANKFYQKNNYIIRKTNVYRKNI